METALVFDVQRYSIHDGPGIRTTVFFKGCPLTCWWCHNPESQGKESFVHYDRTRCLRCGACVHSCPQGALTLAAEGIARDGARCRGCATCATVCPAEARRLVGRRMTVGEVLDDVERDRLFYEESGGGVTLSGGEPLLQWRFLLELLAECGKRDLHRTVDTSGYAPASVLLRVARETDLFLYDLKVMDPVLHRRVTGVCLTPVLKNLSRLLAAGARVWIRIPLVPGVTSDDSIDRTGAFLSSLPAVERVSLLPFHGSARAKHEKFAIPWHPPSDAEIPDDRIGWWAGRLRARGLRVAVGG